LPQNAALAAIEYYLPPKTLTTEELAAERPDWGVEKIDAKTGIRKRHIAGDGVCSSDLAVAAAEKLFASGACRPGEIDFILFCTQTPDYLLPASACLIQDRLGVPTTAGALDFNLGHSGYVYGLGLAQGLIAAGQARNVLLLTADTYSKLIHPEDRSVRTVFGDGGAATLLRAVDGEPRLGPFVYGTDGRGAPNLIVPAGGMREPRSAASAVAATDANGNTRSRDHLFMDGAEIFTFTLDAVPKLVAALLEKAGQALDAIDLFVFHQANGYILEHLRKKAQIPKEKFFVALSHCGNTVSSSIPIALKEAQLAGRLAPGATVMLVGYGVGYSWGATFLRWS
jgi:3-oxoacyl-[acyl-carrier-protein] synthase-3